MRRTICLTALCLALAQPLAAQDDATRALAQEYVDLPAVQSMLDSMFDSDLVMGQLNAMMPQGANVSSEQVRTLSEIVSEELAGVRPELVDAMRDKASAHFTADELQAMITFYRSPEGVSILGKMQPFTIDYMAAVGPSMQAAMQSIMHRASRDLGKP